MTKITYQEGISRRDLLRLSGTVVLTGSLAGCSFLSTDPAGDNRNDGPKVAKGKEAPDLASQVKAGKLPPVEERLPTKPLVVQPLDGIGTYGGSWNIAIPSADSNLNRYIGYTALARWDTTWEQIVPDAAESIEIADDGATYTIHLREGMKWSDGEPFTTDDVMFALTDVMLNKELAPAPSSRLYSDGKLVTVTKVDELTVKFSWPIPNGQFLMSVASMRVPATQNPIHYMKQFHKKYNPDVDKLAKEKGFSDWVRLYTAMGADIFGTPASYYQNPEMPTLNAWMISQAVGDGAKATAVRNPYYWKVDPDGSQLPYVDQVSISIISSPEVMTLKAQSGEIDMQAAFFNTLTNKPVLADAGQSGGYHLFDVTPASMNAMILALNLNHRNATRRSMFQNKDFRIGLSHAINRQEIIDTVMAGQGEPWQAAPRKESALYDEEFAKQYTEFSVDKANEYLDRAGLSKKDSDGMRLGEDGRPISFNVEFQTTYPEHGSALEMIKDYWAAVGITMRPKPDGESLFTSRKESNLIDAVMEPEGQGLLYDVLLEPNPYMPFGDESSYALRWGDWAIGFDVGEQPPAVVKEQLALYNKAMATADLDQQITTMKELMQVAKNQFWQLGIVVPTGAYGIARNAIRNVPKQMFTGGDFCDPGPTNPETYYYA